MSCEARLTSMAVLYICSMAPTPNDCTYSLVTHSGVGVWWRLARSCSSWLLCSVPEEGATFLFCMLRLPINQIQVRACLADSEI